MHVRGKHHGKLFLKRLKSFIRGNRIFSIALATFLVVTTSFAVHNAVGVTPDEAYHYAAIKTYAAQYSPFITEQASLAETNDMVRYPSYLYHYILSFPFRALNGIGLSDHASLVTLRLLNVALGVATVLLLRRLLLAITSKKAANFSAGLFALLPITMIIYGGLNYDNLMLTIIFACSMLLVNLRRQFSWLKLVAFLALLEVGALTQFKFLPIGAALFICLVVILLRDRSHKRVTFRFTTLFAVVFAGFVVASGLVIERYAVNMVSYKNLTPTCQSVHSLSQCLQFPLNERDYAAVHDDIVATQNPITYAAGYWYKNMVRGIIYPSPLLWLRYIFFLAIIIAVIAVLHNREHHYNERWLGLTFIAIALFYTVIVFADNYDYYLRTGLPNTINGRYLLPALPLLFVPMYANIRRSYQRLMDIARNISQRSYQE
jgi:4-amino-4-deoxy-L-arabinose transferase-like glycosyltransferase